jgi:hypothetical protein
MSVVALVVDCTDDITTEFIIDVVCCVCDGSVGYVVCSAWIRVGDGSDVVFSVNDVDDPVDTGPSCVSCGCCCCCGVVGVGFCWGFGGGDVVTLLLEIVGLRELSDDEVFVLVEGVVTFDEGVVDVGVGVWLWLVGKEGEEGA